MSATTPSKTFLAPRYYRNFITWIIGHLFKHKVQFLVGYVFFFLGTMISVLIPLVLQYFFDQAILMDFNTIFLVCLSFLGLYTINFLASIIGAWTNAIFSEKVVRNVQIEFFESIHDKSMQFHDSARTGELLAMATSDSRQLSWMLLSILMLSIAFFTAVSALAMMYFLNQALFTIFIVFLPLIAVSIIYYARSLGPVSIERQKLFGQWQATLQENLAGIRVLRTLSNRSREFEKYEDDLTSVREILIKRSILSSRYFPTLFIYLAMGAIFIAGGIQVYQGVMTPGTLIAFNSLTLLLLTPAEFIRFTVFLGSMGFAGGKRVFDVINEQQSMEEGSVKVDKRLRGKIIFKNVSFQYDANGPKVLDDLSFFIAPGQTVAILGHTGCGKTTLQKLVQRLYDPTEGEILIDDVNIKDYQIDSLRRQTGVIEQDIFLFSASIKENIMYGCGGGNIHPDLEHRMVQMAKSAQIHDFIASLPKGYDTVIGERGVTLSGGQRQRLAIARAFMVNPPILIMDDSTSAVDAATEAKIQTALKLLLESRTTIIVTHRLATLRKADVVILMEQGKIKDIGNHKALYNRNPDYASIFRQFEDLPPIPTEMYLEQEVV